MKRMILPLMLLFAANLYGQERMVLVEHFTNASCNLCGLYDPNVPEELAANSEIAIGLQYHIPTSGDDPLADLNPDLMNARKDFYEISTPPNSVLDGNYFQGGPPGSAFNGNPGWGTDTLVARSMMTPGATIDLTANLDPSFSTLSVDVSATAIQEIVNATLHIAVIEKVINFDEAPGTNGITSFSNVVKQFLPSNEGTAVTALIAGQSTSAQATWAIADLYDISNLAVVAFIQDNDTKEVYQAAMVEPQTESLSINANIIDIEGIPDGVCSTQLTPVVVVRNDGQDNINSFLIQYSINGGTIYSFNWTGSIPPLEQLEISVPTINFTESDTYELVVEVLGVNDGADALPENNIYTYNFTAAPLTEDQLTLEIFTDGFACENYWEILDGNNAIIASGGNPVATAGENGVSLGSNGLCEDDGISYDSDSLYTQTIDISELGCYTFRIIDDAGDGMCCTYGDGYYKLIGSTGAILFEGSEFEEEKVHFFEVKDSVMVANEALTLNNSTSIIIYPNPANQQVNVQLQEVYEHVQISLFDMKGQLVQSTNVRNINEYSFDITDLYTGQYLLIVNDLENNVRIGKEKLMVLN